MSVSQDMVPAGNVETTPDPPSVPMANAQNHTWFGTGHGWSSTCSMLTEQAGDMTGTLQQGVRARLTRANTPPPELRGHADELAQLKSAVAISEGTES